MQEGIAHGAGSLPALCSVFCKGSIDDLANRLRNVGRALSQRNRRLFEYRPNRVVNAAVLAQVERQAASQKTVRRHADSIDI